MDSYRRLLKRAARLYEMYEAGRPEPFNIFSVLDIERDEVNCHSRFLKALLDYEKPGDKVKDNLVDFLQGVVGVDNVDSFKQGVRVEREKDRIDLRIITSDKQHAVVIENKIGAGDQAKQLCRYYRTMKDHGYGNVRLLYLTLKGDDPSEDSFCGPHCEARSHCEAISYRDTLPAWLERCQQRAYDEPGLRESIAQYRQLVQKLTGTDFGGAYMNELTELVLEGGNLVLVHDLNEAMIKAKVRRWQELWCEIDAALNNAIADLPPINPNFAGEPHASEEEVRLFLTGRRGHNRCGRFYPFGDGGAALAVQASIWWDRLRFGVYCYTQTNQLRNATQNVQGGATHGRWTWFRDADGLNVRNTSREDLRRLSNEADRRAHAESIAQGLKPVWEAVRAAGLAGQNP